ncbi:MAG: phosphatidate cytidylyltransferase, partial [Pseudomonadota bacterium]
MSDLPMRLASALVLGCVFAITAWFGGFAFLLVLCVASCAIWSEWCGMRMPDVDDRLLLLGTCAIVLMSFVMWLSSSWTMWLLVAAIILLFAICAARLGQSKAVKGFLYAATLLITVGHLRGGGDELAGFAAICFLCAVVFATDIGAYFVGRWLGGPKLLPSVSPNKTISGATGGLMAAIILATVTYAGFELEPLWIAIVLALVLSALAQLGDLYESSMERNAGVKDSGQVIPGHGGVMDRVDGLLFASFG